jgi:hypothetical protein
MELLRHAKHSIRNERLPIVRAAHGQPSRAAVTLHVKPILKDYVMKVSMGKVKTAISFMAFAAVAGTFAPEAHARVIAQVEIRGNTWGTAWKECRMKNRKTQSVKFVKHVIHDGIIIGEENVFIGSKWNCYDTPNTR